MRIIYIVYQVFSVALLFLLYINCLNEFGLTRNWSYVIYTLPPTIMYFYVSSLLRKMIDDNK